MKTVESDVDDDEKEIESTINNNKMEDDEEVDVQLGAKYLM